MQKLGKVLLFAIVWTSISGGEWNGPGVVERQIMASLSTTPVHFSSYDFTIFVLAAESGDEPLIKQYLLDGMDPNAQDMDGNTALMAATLNGHLGMVRILLKAEADPNIRNSEKLSAVDFAVIHQDFRTAEILKMVHPEPIRHLSSARDK